MFEGEAGNRWMGWYEGRRSGGDAKWRVREGRWRMGEEEQLMLLLLLVLPPLTCMTSLFPPGAKHSPDMDVRKPPPGSASAEPIPLSSSGGATVFGAARDMGSHACRADRSPYNRRWEGRRGEGEGEEEERWPGSKEERDGMGMGMGEPTSMGMGMGEPTGMGMFAIDW